MSSPHRPRRVARLVAAIAGVFAGLFYVFFPPNTTTAFLDAAWPAQVWGVFFLLGGFICAAAWWSRVLIMDRIGLSFLITATVALLFTQTGVMLNHPITYTRGGGTVVLAILAGFLIARWQDVRHDEQEAQAAIAATGGGQVGERH